jgi:hypothetical protein
MLTPPSRKFPQKQIPMIQITLDRARVQFLLQFTTLIPAHSMGPFVESAVSRLSLVLSTSALTHSQVSAEDHLSLVHDVSYLQTYLLLADPDEIALFRPHLVIWGLLEAEIGEFFDFMNTNSLFAHPTRYDHLIRALHQPHNHSTPYGPPCASILAIIAGVESYLSIVCGSSWADANKIRHQVRRSLN